MFTLGIRIVNVCFAAFVFTIDLLVSYEYANLSMSGSALFSDPLPFVTLIFMMLIDTVIYAFLAWFFENVLPNEYGTKRPLLFLCSRSYWYATSLISYYFWRIQLK